MLPSKSVAFCADDEKLNVIDPGGLRAMKDCFIRTFLFTVTIALLVFSVPRTTFAQDYQGTIIYGHDYDMFLLNRNESWRACKNECEVDKACAAWTFVRSKRQCRLKKSIGQRERNRCCTSGVVRKKEATNRDSAKGRITSVHVNMGIKGRDVCILMKPGIPVGQGWACVWENGSIGSSRLAEMLLTAYAMKLNCSVSWPNKLRDKKPSIDSATCTQ